MKVTGKGTPLLSDLSFNVKCGLTKASLCRPMSTSNLDATNM